MEMPCAAVCKNQPTVSQSHAGQSQARGTVAPDNLFIQGDAGEGWSWGMGWRGKDVTQRTPQDSAVGVTAGGRGQGPPASSPPATGRSCLVRLFSWNLKILEEKRCLAPLVPHAAACSG